MAMPVAVAKAIQAGRSTGKFNLSGRQLDALPLELWDENLPLPATGGTANGGGGPSWWEVSAPQRLELARNKLTSLPEHVGTWEGLTLLDVSHNLMALLPQALGRLHQLGTLTANNNTLQALPALPPSLVVLNLQHNQLACVPASLGHCTQITSMDFSHNRVQEVPAQVCLGCCSLVTLTLNNNQLRHLPDELGNLRKLQVLNVEYNQLQALPPSIGGCTALLEVHAGYNKLRALPVELAGCKALRHLAARDNQLTDFPAQLCSLKLGCLDLQNCDLAGLPPELGGMTTLRALRLEGNAVKTIRRALISGPVSALLSYLKSRLPEEDTGRPMGPVQSGNVFGMDPHQLAAEAAKKLVITAVEPPQAQGNPRGQGRVAPPPFATETNGIAPPARAAAGGGPQARGVGGAARPTPELLLPGMGLTAVPQDVWAALPSLTKLDLSANQLSHLPPEAWLCARELRVLLLSRLPLIQWALPWADPHSLPCLQHLSLAGCNQLRNIPPGALCSCADTLTTLDLSGVPGACNLPPGTLASLTLLETLDLSSTGTATFPLETLQLAGTLRVLRLNGNRIATLPGQIQCMTRLDELQLANNELGSLPAVLGLLSSSLKALTLDGNPLRSIRRPILDKGTAGVLAYLRDRLPVP